MVHRPDRLCDIMVEMRNNQLEPKGAQNGMPRAGDAPSLLLIKGIRRGNSGMKLLAPPLYIRCRWKLYQRGTIHIRLVGGSLPRRAIRGETMAIHLKAPVDQELLNTLKAGDEC